VIHLMGERRIRMGQRYPVSLQQFGNQARFERAETVLGLWTAGEGPLPLVPAPGVLAMAQPEGLALTPETPKPLAWSWPAIPDTAKWLPILKLSLHSRHPNELAMAWQTASAEYAPDFVPLLIKAPVPAGDSDVYLPLLDPDAVGPLAFRLSRQTGSLTLRRVEIRGVPRN